MARTLLLACLLVVAVMGTVSLAQWNPSYYPNLQPGWGGQFFNTYPTQQFGCRYWCRSTFTGQYYCCQTPHQAAINNPYPYY
ncbi:uncharacterized protein LOC123503218 [Portunus trituberculatus]|uniref:Uncharacterized protein n=1 Tax=Portunus trituberculatus TaxID=210409 RepID=A0A5B7GE26_PORTR|nr:uncharacterized protein LOC123503218 [Portunus trituberculatus]XP_045108707.1 uncharacterized protein LOC123503218 [Portunus trituberculatus]MPC55543.1 hypothetical protein [Portunus trituberculatus]